ncbi:MAG: hypothetical protein M5R36_10550 [Deltaproteobacteria bacterium]|nr:hypothetical protein [Deltaproteobacteria bacterium]
MPYRLILLVLALFTASALVASGCDCTYGGGDDDDDDDDDVPADDDTASGDDDTAAADDDDDGGVDPFAECEFLEDPTTNEACRNCVIQCNLAVQSGVDLSAGPCLSEMVLEDWVCDVVHSPRQPVDELLDNQCAQYPDVAHHKVEVTPECRVVTAQ